MIKTTLTISLIMLALLVKGQITRVHTFRIDTPDSVSFTRLKDWVTIRGSLPNFLIDYINLDKKKVGITQNVPVRYIYLGNEGDGGHIGMTSVITISNGKLEYVIKKGEHQSGPSTGHNSGGDIFTEKPPKGKGIREKTWLGYQDMFSQFIDQDVYRLKEHLNGY